MGSNLLLRGAKEGVSRNVWREEDGPPSAERLSFALAFRVSFAGNTVPYLVSHLAFKPCEAEILSKALDIEDGKEPVGTFTALDTLAFEDLVWVVKL